MKYFTDHHLNIFGPKSARLPDYRRPPQTTLVSHKACDLCKILTIPKFEIPEQRWIYGEWRTSGGRIWWKWRLTRKIIEKEAFYAGNKNAEMSSEAESASSRRNEKELTKIEKLVSTRVEDLCRWSRKENDRDCRFAVTRHTSSFRGEFLEVHRREQKISLDITNLIFVYSLIYIFVLFVFLKLIKLSNY